MALLFFHSLWYKKGAFYLFRKHPAHMSLFMQIIWPLLH